MLRLENIHKLSGSKHPQDNIFEILAEESPNMIFINNGRRLLYVNEQCVESLGYAKKELLSKNFDFKALVSPESWSMIRDNFTLPMKEEEIEPFEYKLLTKDEKELFVIHTSKLFEFHGEKALFSIVTDITARRRAEDAVMNIAQTVSGSVGEHFFNSLIENLAEQLKADYVYIAEIFPDNPGRVRTISMFADGEFVDNIVTDLDGTPCEKVMGSSPCSYPADVRKLFPRAEIMAAMNVESYFGIQLTCSSGKRLGLMSVMFRMKIHNTSFIETMLTIFAARASAELERKQTEEELKKHRGLLEELVGERTFELSSTNNKLKKEIRVRKQVEKRLIDYQKQLQSLASQMSLVEERERRRIASELHDSLGQTLALAKIKLGQCNKSAGSVPGLNDNIRDILLIVEQCIKETRSLTFELSPPVLYELGLDQAIKWLVDQFKEKFSIQITFTSEGIEGSFDSNIRFFLFQAVRELIFNIVKHADSQKADISLTARDGRLRIQVEDYGKGFVFSPEKTTGYGLFNLRERFNLINGNVIIQSNSGSGTKVILEAPFQFPTKL